MNKLFQPPVFIIGAGRSGTNILRDSLCSFHNLITWPCDEINLVFRHGNRTLPNDEFGQEHANEVARQYVVRTFEELQANVEKVRIVEKTCANSLRVPFLNSIFPEAKFIFILRDGYDVTASALKRWKAPIEPAYLWKKFRYVPKSDVPYYALQFIRNRFVQWRSDENRQGKWGPVYKGMEEDLLQLSLAEVAAKQWARCVEKASKDFYRIEPDRTYFLTYEHFVQNPIQAIAGIKDWLNEDWTRGEIEFAVKAVRKSSLGHAHFGSLELEKVKEIVDPIMEKIYDPISKKL